MGASQPSMWLYGFAWAEAAPQTLIPTRSKEESEKRPRDESDEGGGNGEDGESETSPHTCGKRMTKAVRGWL